MDDLTPDGYVFSVTQLPDDVIRQTFRAHKPRQNAVYFQFLYGELHISDTQMFVHNERQHQECSCVFYDVDTHRRLFQILATDFDVPIATSGKIIRRITSVLQEAFQTMTDPMAPIGVKVALCRQAYESQQLAVVYDPSGHDGYNGDLYSDDMIRQVDELLAETDDPGDYYSDKLIQQTNALLVDSYGTSGQEGYYSCDFYSDDMIRQVDELLAEADDPWDYYSDKLIQQTNVLSVDLDGKSGHEGYYSNDFYSDDMIRQVDELLADADDPSDYYLDKLIQQTNVDDLLAETDDSCDYYSDKLIQQTNVLLVDSDDTSGNEGYYSDDFWSDDMIRQVNELLADADDPDDSYSHKSSQQTNVLLVDSDVMSGHERYYSDDFYSVDESDQQQISEQLDDHDDTSGHERYYSDDLCSDDESDQQISKHSDDTNTSDDDNYNDELVQRSSEQLDGTADQSGHGTYSDEFYEELNRQLNLLIAAAEDLSDHEDYDYEYGDNYYYRYYYDDDSTEQDIVLESDAINFVPASGLAIDELERFRYEGGDKNCVVCLTELDEGCLYHVDCIVKSLSISHMCPICRFEFPTDSTQISL